MRFPTLAAWLAWQATLHPHEIELGLERCAHVATHMGILPLPCPVITVGGTNGKGSCVTLLDHIYQTAGYRTARYLSPHLLQFTERLCFNNVQQTEAQWCAAFAQVDGLRGDISLTQFEFITLAALWMIAQQPPEVAILEIGLGGRLDVVNIVESDVALITNVALDHMDWLGDSRAQIGFEKAGIFRPQKPAVYGEAEPPESVLQHAQAIGTPLLIAGHDFQSEIHADHTWSWRSVQQHYEHLPLPALQGDYQVDNAASVLMALQCLQRRLPVTQATIEYALQHCQLLGRLYCLTQPWRVFDVAHNPHGVTVLQHFLAQHRLGGRIHAVVGIMRDKASAELLAIMLPIISVWHVAAPAVARAAPASRLQQELQQLGAQEIQTYMSIAAAYQQAVSQLGETDQLVVFGSFFTVAEALQAEGITG